MGEKKRKLERLKREALEKGEEMEVLRPPPGKVKEAVAKANAAGYPVLVVSGADEGEETMSNEWGTWNVTRALADCIADKVGRLVTLDMAKLYAANSDADFDEAKVQHFMNRPDILAKPLLLRMQGGVGWLIDGIHRVNAHERMGNPVGVGYLLSEEQAEKYRVRFIAVEPDGSHHIVPPAELGLVGKSRPNA